jgi:hypothetical protein
VTTRQHKVKVAEMGGVESKEMGMLALRTTFIRSLSRLFRRIDKAQVSGFPS